MTQKIGDIIGELLKNPGIREKIEVAKIENIWEDAVGITIAKNTSIQRIDRGKLIVKVTTPVWRNELILKKYEIMKRLNEKQQFKIREIRFI